MLLIGGDASERTRCCNAVSSSRRFLCSTLRSWVNASWRGGRCSCNIRDNCARLDSFGWDCSGAACAACACDNLLTAGSAGDGECAGLAANPACCEPRVDQLVSCIGCCSLACIACPSLTIVSRVALHVRWFG